MTSHKKRVGTIGPKKFVHKLKEENIMFRGLTQQDAHEFLNYTINEISDLVRCDDERAAKLAKKDQIPLPNTDAQSPPADDNAEDAARKKRTWVHDVFGGVLTNETRCLNCECITSRYAHGVGLLLVLHLLWCACGLYKWTAAYATGAETKTF